MDSVTPVYPELPSKTVRIIFSILSRIQENPDCVVGIETPSLGVFKQVMGKLIYEYADRVCVRVKRENVVPITDRSTGHIGRKIDYYFTDDACLYFQSAMTKKRKRPKRKN